LLGEFTEIKFIDKKDLVFEVSKLYIVEIEASEPVEPDSTTCERHGI
jgi:hypothetical protein